MNDPLALMIDLERCTGCKSCEAACKQANVLGPHTYRNRVMWLGQEDQPRDEAQVPALLDFLTVTCQQCERPACLRACPVTPGAISKDPETGVVAINEDRCTGCGECAVACPYGAIGYDPEHHHAVKCDLCAGRRAEGEGPACASVCPTQAIQFGTRSEHLAHAEARQRSVLDTDLFLQKPATVYLARLTDDTQTRRHEWQTVPDLLQDDTARDGLMRDTTPPDRSVPPMTHAGGCNICFNACPITYETRNGQITQIYGNRADPVFQGRICPKSQMTLQMYDSPHRLLYPMKRDGDGHSRISWEQALDEIATKLERIRETYGPEALAIQAGSRTGTMNILGIIPIFAKMWGTGNTASTEPFCDIGKVVALESTLGSTMMPNVYTPEDIGSAELYLYIGDNQAETRPVNFGLVNDWRLKNGARMVVVDPRMTATASKADVWHAIRPGTDMALGLGLCHHILNSGLHDVDFCTRHIEGFEVWRDFILAQGYSPDWAAQQTELDATAIRELAVQIARADGTMIFLSRGINQHSNSAQTNRVFLFLAAITGNFGRRGGGFLNVSAEPDWGLPEVPADRMPARRPAVSKNPAAWVGAMLGEEGPYPIRALITGNNPMALWPDAGRARKALEGLDLVVHMDLYRNATSALADYLLPMASGAEKGGPSRLAEDRRIVWNDKLIDPPGEARSDHWVWIELGKRLGFSDILREAFNDPRVLWDEVLRPATPALNGVSINRLMASPSRTVRYPVAEETSPETDTLYLSGTTAFGQPSGRFPTETGRLEFHTPALVERFAQVGLSPLPEYYSDAPNADRGPTLDRTAEPVLSPFFGPPVLTQPAEISAQAQEEQQSEFDTELVTGRPPAPHFHSWTHYFWQAQEMWPQMYCQIHPAKADPLGIADGDMVEIRTTKGSITARAWRYAGIRKSAIFVPIGWDEYQPHQPANPVNLLTGLEMDPVSQQPNLKLTMCAVTKV